MDFEPNFYELYKQAEAEAADYKAKLHELAETIFADKSVWMPERVIILARAALRAAMEE